MNDPGQLFSRQFLAEFEISEDALTGHAILPVQELVSLERDQIDRRLGSDLTVPYVEIDEVFWILRLAAEDPSEALGRFITCFQAIGWSDEAQSSLNFASTWNTDDQIAAIHIRAGDIVTGGWRHFMFYGKYMPVPYVSFAIDELSHGGRKPVLVMSDNAELLLWLQTRHANIVTVSEVVPGYARLPEILKAFADMLLMSRCHTIVGPSESAFSALAADLGRSRVMSAERLIPAGQAHEVLRSGSLDTQGSIGEYPFLMRFVARDLVWYLDVFGDGVPLREQLTLARDAVRFDPDFVGARTRLGLLAALLGEWDSAREAVAKAEAIGRTVVRHQGALFEAQATHIAVECFALTLGRGTRRLRSRSARTRSERDKRKSLAELHDSLSQLNDADLFHLDRNEIMLNLRGLLATVDWLMEVSDPVRAQLWANLLKWRNEEVDISRFRSPLEGAHQTVAVFEAVVRNFERAVIYLSRAVGGSIDPRDFDVGPGVRGDVDDVTLSRNGVRWIEGWVIGPGESVSGFSRALAMDSRHDGGATGASTVRADIAAHYGNPQGCASGFRLPIPKESGIDELGGSASPIWGLSSAGHRSPLAQR